jgi:Uma2 family endonuclease
VAFGVPKQDREMYLGWQEPRLPNVVIEVTTKGTELDDTGTKFRVYRDDWQVEEYFLFDPGREYLDPPLQGYRMARGKFARIRRTAGGLTSSALGLRLSCQGPRLVLHDATTGEELLTAEAEVARLKAELPALRKPPTA